MGDLSCETQLEELMHQIDIMVNSKKVEWEQQVLALEQRLETQELELSQTRGALDEKDYEIAALSKKLEEADKSQCETVQNYEHQLEALKSQLCKLKTGYGKLHYYHMKNHTRESIDASTDHEKSQSELRRLSQKLEEYKEQAREWENQRLRYQNNMQKLNEQRKNLLEKCDSLQKQSQSHQEQLSGRTRLQDEAITNNQSEIRRLRCQLHASQETIISGRVIIENLKSTVKEITLSRNLLKDENQRLLQQLRDCQKRCQRMENKLLTIELQAQEDLSRAAEMDQRDLQTFILQYSEEKKLSAQDSDVFMKERTPNREKVQKRLKLSLCKEDQDEKDFSMKESRNSGLERLRADVSNLTEKLHQKDMTITAISQKVSRLERELDMKEHGDVHQQVLRSAEEPYPSHDPTLEPEVEKQLKNFFTGHDLEVLQPEMMKPYSLHKEITRKLSQGTQSRSIEDDEQTLKMADHDTNHNLSCDRLLLDQECLEYILPQLKSPTLDDHPEMDFIDFSFLVCDQSGDFTAVPSPEESFVSAAERFLQEENRRALDFENLLNSHIEELQRYSERTVKRYSSPLH
ncbi:deuterosome assembly protein 1-like [Bufo gargarizans]|uniref:deuterosome assembly protein 1-like n=1 Tax=Bufo gargarizans TaxID=30331 RepID=UPI001CF208AA|nr:deuterosome assembly protein 1-like [Bufo gargarizans]XP_044143721.1 deuterosome assembly protein 1-like [Bufo gargarizans]XP_044143722.1 deuterosome assembly protein 1-like [Bufo gargarizans]